MMLFPILITLFTVINIALHMKLFTIIPLLTYLKTFVSQL